MTAARLESLLRSAPFAPARLAELDLREEFPEEACDALDAFGLNRYYVPVRHGGLLADFPELTRMLRAVAGCDLTVAVAHAKTLLGAVSVWVAGDPEQAGRLAARILDGSVVAWGLTERDHGGDLLAGELTATRDGEGWRLDGEKWLINNATRGDQICVLARTEPRGGPRGFSLFLVDKTRLPADACRPLPKVLTHGVRGADISGIVFHAAPLAGDALVGGTGQGTETVLRSLQLTRTMCSALSLGAADHGLRLAADFVRGRELYGRFLADLPRVRRILGRAVAALLTVEAASTVAARSLHALPGEMSVVSAVTKAFAPTAVQQVLDRLGELLGARGFLTGVYAEGMFAKLERDHRIVGIFDGSTPVNRYALINQFPRLARAYRAARWNGDGLAEATRLDAPLGDLDLSRLTMLSAEGCSVVQALPQAVRQVEELATRDPAHGDVAGLALRLAAEADELHRELAEHVPRTVQAPASAFRLAERYELLFAGAAALWLWLGASERRQDGPLWRDALWLRGCLVWVLSALGAENASQDQEVWDLLAEQLLGADSGVLSPFGRARAAAPAGARTGVEGTTP
ncbi:acyl-CoA dehydrogenase family protein [Streptosporangium carneum]|uniref:Acyl-CoA dehydrogenase n=1 Tax=Streptosporangium carneum TaxID=47481 RepID=A0A9W6MHW7_9ACTN|nr:acyl-CoA dehydrogenase family protein [Streptosporangium carneum]GLK14635.1 acyl-CoA dehydrogenase [Streptosporangium carneum]